MKALIITYYWPPAGGSGVQRWLKFVKYLRDFGIEPVVYTVDKPNYLFTDAELEKEIPNNIEILRQPIFEPNDIFSFFKSNKSKAGAGFLSSNPSFVEKKLNYIRANYFIPDARKFWVKPSVKFLSKYIENNKIDVVITTGPPHSVHLIGLALKERLKVKWIADFRDPWTNIDYFHQLDLTKKAKQKHFDLEEKVLKSADAIIVVGKTMKAHYNKFNKHIHVITNGYDSKIENKNIPLDEKFSISHVGMMNDDRNPKILWQALKELVAENDQLKSDLQVNLIGGIGQEVNKSIEANGLSQFVHSIDYLPHNEVGAYQKKSQLLLLLVNKVPFAKGIITGKVFEYMHANRPILAISPLDGDLNELIDYTNTGQCVEFSDERKIKEVILSYYNDFKKGSLSVNPINIEQFHRKELTNKLAILIKDTING